MEDTNTPVQQTTPTVPDRKGLAIASLVLGIVSLVFFCLWYISIPCAVLGIIFGTMSKTSSGAGMAKAGLICSIIAIAIAILALTILAGFFAAIMGSVTGDSF